MRFSVLFHRVAPKPGAGQIRLTDKSSAEYLRRLLQTRETMKRMQQDCQDDPAFLAAWETIRTLCRGSVAIPCPRLNLSGLHVRCTLVAFANMYVIERHRHQQFIEPIADNHCLAAVTAMREMLEARLAPMPHIVGQTVPPVHVEQRGRVSRRYLSGRINHSSRWKPEPLLRLSKVPAGNSITFHCAATGRRLNTSHVTSITLSRIPLTLPR